MHIFLIGNTVITSANDNHNRRLIRVIIITCLPCLAIYICVCVCVYVCVCKCVCIGA